MARIKMFDTITKHKHHDMLVKSVSYENKTYYIFKCRICKKVRTKIENY